MKLSPRAYIVLASSLLLAACPSDPELGPGSEPSAPPLPASPNIPAKECTIDLARWNISNDGTRPDETTDGINAALQALVGEGCGRVKLPTGHYAIGKRLSDSYTGGIVLPSRMTLVMDDNTVLQLRPTDTWAYCVIDISNAHDVGVSGGSIIGDRDVHDFKVNGEEGHCICIEDESERVAIDRVRLSKAIGDGVLIVAQGEEGSSCKDISITNSEIFDNRRQGISIVGGMRVLIENNEIHHINGTAPQFGIDIESLKYKSQDITIRNNQFHHNRGGDFVNTDGRGVLLERNTMRDGDGNRYIDGPIIYWSNTDQIIRGNHITMALGSANGKMGILEYSHKTPRTNPTRNLVEENTLEGCSIDLMHDSLVTVRRNTVRNASIILYHVEDVELVENTIEKEGRSYSYMIHKSTGTASGNILNGTPYEIAITPDAPFSNWDGQ
ncbi:right-handed parallel beta-helix repeat-containing protein [Archangium minus]|uniref:Right-handed parallel beta-helix repeat-containing protein n=1 Tax=Archangium minus TaxID=83450 RepID=A0ABY9WTP9_9BACT|nr:right-handed parallel beta-helix repeat-containing protein [Archangium minus]